MDIDTNFFLLTFIADKNVAGRLITLLSITFITTFISFLLTEVILAVESRILYLGVKICLLFSQVCNKFFIVTFE
jgi:hypothetical protein